MFWKRDRRDWKWEILLIGALVLIAAVGASLERQAVKAASGRDIAVQLPVAMYHSVTDEGDSPGAYVISPTMLENDLKYLFERGYETVTIGDLEAYVFHGTPLPEKPVMLTFDDGYYNNYKYAYPLLKKYHMQAVFSPVGILVQQFSQSNDTEKHETWSYCTGAEVKEMADAGIMEIQNHTFDFHQLSPRKGCLPMEGESEEEYREIFFSDTKQAQELFASIGVPEPFCYTYPYGAKDAMTDQMVTEYGFLASLSCEEGIANIVHDKSCLRNIRRYNRDGRLRTEEFWSKLLEQLGEGG